MRAAACPIFATDSKSLQGKEGARRFPLPHRAAPGRPSWQTPSHAARRPLFLPLPTPLRGRRGPASFHQLGPEGAAATVQGPAACLPAGTPGLGDRFSIWVCSFLTEVIPAQSPKSLHYFLVNRAFPSQNHQHFCVAPTSGFDWPRPRMDAGALTLWRGRRGRPASLPRSRPGQGRGGRGRETPGLCLCLHSLPGPRLCRGSPGLCLPVAVFSALPAQSSWPQPSPPGVPHTPGQ